MLGSRNTLTTSLWGCCRKPSGRLQSWKFEIEPLLGPHPSSPYWRLPRLANVRLPPRRLYALSQQGSLRVLDWLLGAPDWMPLPTNVLAEGCPTHHADCFLGDAWVHVDHRVDALPRALPRAPAPHSLAPRCSTTA